MAFCIASAASPAANTPGTELVFIIGSVRTTRPSGPSSKAQPSCAASVLPWRWAGATNSASSGKRRPSSKRTASSALAGPSSATTRPVSIAMPRASSCARVLASSGGMPCVNSVSGPQSATSIAWCTDSSPLPSTPRRRSMNS